MGLSGVYVVYKELFFVCIKEFFSLNFARLFIEKFIFVLSYESDGLIF